MFNIFVLIILLHIYVCFSFFFEIIALLRLYSLGVLFWPECIVPQGYLICYLRKDWRLNPSVSARVSGKRMRQALGWSLWSLLSLAQQDILLAKTSPLRLQGQTTLGGVWEKWTPIESQSPTYFHQLFTPTGLLFCRNLHLHHGSLHSCRGHSDCGGRQGQGMSQFYLIYLSICPSAPGYSHFRPYSRPFTSTFSHSKPIAQSSFPPPRSFLIVPWCLHVELVGCYCFVLLFIFISCIPFFPL